MVKREFIVEAADKIEKAQDGSIKLTMCIPENWTVDENIIFEGERKVGEILPYQMVSDKDNPFRELDAINKDTTSIEELTLSFLLGKLYI